MITNYCKSSTSSTIDYSLYYKLYTRSRVESDVQNIEEVEEEKMFKFDIKDLDT